jgi:cytochrome c oxidase assembly factor CtaG
MWFAAGGVALVVVALVPPVSAWADRYEAVEALRFSIFAVIAPALVVIGAPWAVLRPAPPALIRLADGRRRHPAFLLSLGFLALDLAVLVSWRSPLFVDAVSRHRWLAIIEAASLLIVGVGLWLELVESPPLIPRSARPRRALLAALAMWTVWTVAYLQAMANSAWYRGFHHVAGNGLSAAADRQISTIVLWAVAALVFMPVIFWNLVQWLRSEDDPDDELYRLLREERRRSAGVLRTTEHPSAPSE